MTKVKNAVNVKGKLFTTTVFTVKPLDISGQSLVWNEINKRN